MKDKLWFIIKFLVFSTILFILWIFIGKFYLIFLAFTAKFLLHLMGYAVELVINEQIMFTYLGAEMSLNHAELANYNIIPFIALVLATPQSLRKSIQNLFIGIPVIFLFHFIDLVAHFPMYYDGNILANFIVSFSVITRMLIPFLLWFALSYDWVLASFRNTKKIYQCPLCDKKVKGIQMHIDDVHHQRNKEEQKKYQQYLKRHTELK